MSKADYSVEDFILDPDFQGWILGNDMGRRAYWEDFLAKHPEKIADIKLARQVLVNLSKKKSVLSDFAKDELWMAISQKLDADVQSEGEAKVVSLSSWAAIQQYNLESAQKSKSVWRMKAGAVIVLLGILGLFVGRTFSTSEEVVPMVVHTEVLQAPPGVKSTITLEDGSVVSLNSGSKISYIKGFTDSLRFLTLEGEAYFDVASDASRPFVVQTGPISTQALGTEFNISSFPGDSISISLVTGEVLVRDEVADLEQRLVPGEGVRAFLDNPQWTKTQFDQEKVLSWMNKTLIFEQHPFGVASKKLESWFGVEIIFENSIPQHLHVSGKFVDESLENILKGLSYTSRFNYRIQGKKVHIQFKT